MNRQLQTILRNPNHPLQFLINPATRYWFGRVQGLEVPAVQAGHAESLYSEAPERLFLEDADFNQTSNWVGESKGAVFQKGGIVIGGVPVERSTAMMWQRLGLLPGGTVESSPSHPGWTPF